MCLIWMVNYVCGHNYKLDQQPVFCDDWLIGPRQLQDHVDCVAVWGFSSNDCCPTCDKMFRFVTSTIMHLGEKPIEDSFWMLMRGKNRLLNLWYLRRLYRVYNGTYIVPCEHHVFLSVEDGPVKTMLGRMWGQWWDGEEYIEAALLKAFEETVEDAKTAGGSREGADESGPAAHLKIALEDFFTPEERAQRDTRIKSREEEKKRQREK